MEPVRLLAFAVASGKAGYVGLHGEDLCHWGIAIKPTRHPDDLARFAQGQIDEFAPDVVVTEAPSRSCRKGARTRTLILSIAQQAASNEVLDVAVPRVQHYRSKYQEAEALVKSYRDLIGYLPKRTPRFYEPEPRSMILFEALALAEAVKYGPQR